MILRRMESVAAVLALCAGVVLAADAKAGEAERLAREGDDLYRKGAYSEALRRFEAALSAGLETPSILYQAGNCYRVTMSDTARELDYKKRAVPLLEKEISAGRGGIDSHYYLAAIYIHNLADPVKGVEVARKGVALVEKSPPDLRTPVENLYRAARLYEFLGKDAEAARMDSEFLEAAAVSPTAVDRASVRIAREKLGAHLMRVEKYKEAAKVYEALVKADPVRDAERHQWGVALLRSGDPAGASRAWRKASSDEYRTELAYLDKIASRYVQAGAPAESKKVPGAATLPDDQLATRIIEAGTALREYKSAAEAKAKADREEKVAEARRRREEIMNLTPEERKARWEAKKKELAAQGGGDGEEGSNDGPSDRPAPTGVTTLPQKSPEWKAAEREFFYLLTEYIKRGHLVRMFCFQNGLSDLVFR